MLLEFDAGGNGISMPTLKSRLGAILIPMLPVNRRTFDILRYEWRALTVRGLNRISPRHRARVRALRRQRGLSVNLGSGGKGLSGWINTELRRHPDTSICIDMRRPLPFADGSVARIMAEHVVEHVDFKHDAPAILREIHRILEPGGIVRIVVPDAERYIRAYATKDANEWKALGFERLPDDLRTPMHAINHVFSQDGEHLFGYDFETLAWALRDAGFSNVERTEFGKSADPALAIDQQVHRPYSLYVEARK